MIHSTFVHRTFAGLLPCVQQSRRLCRRKRDDVHWTFWSSCPAESQTDQQAVTVKFEWREEPSGASEKTWMDDFQGGLLGGGDV